MNRLHCLLATALTFVLATGLVEQTKRGASLGPGQMIALRGGGAQAAKCNGRCDQITGVYSGCTQDGGGCAQCITTDDMGNVTVAKADYLGQAGTPCGSGGFKEGQQTQNCGTILYGTCSADPTSPTGFKCSGSDSGRMCSQGVFVITPQ